MQDITNNESNFAVIASAGSGKTFQLVLRVVSLLLNGINPKDILALTFTNEATNEMSNRIIELLNYLATSNEGDNPSLERTIVYLEPIYRRLSKKYNVDYNRKFINEISSSKLEMFLKEYANLNIQTIDSYVNKVISIFPFESSITPGFSIINDDKFDGLIDDVFADVIDNLLSNSSKFEEIIFFKSRTFDKSPTKILSFIKDIAEFVASNYISLKYSIEKLVIEPSKIYERILELENVEKDIMQALGTIKNIFRIKLESEDLESIKFKNKKTIINSIKALLECRYINSICDSKLLLDTTLFNKAVELLSPDIRVSVLREKILSQLKEYLKEKGGIVKITAMYIGSKLHTQLEKKKRSKNVLTFSDITDAAFKILCENDIDADYRYFRLDAKINHILVDEFQDTSLLQWSIIKPLVDEAVAGKGQQDKIGSFFFVGDDKQMLYRFRGSSTNLSKLVVDEYIGKINLITLDKNYRSDKNIVNFVNELFGKIVKDDAFSTLENINMYNFNQIAVSENYGFVAVDIIDKGNEEYVNFTIQKINELIEKGFEYRNIAVLLPTNEQGFTLRSTLISYNIPTQLITSFKIKNGNVYKIISSLISYMYFKNNIDLLTYLFLKPTEYNTSLVQDKTKFISLGSDILASIDNNEPSIVKQLLNLFDKLRIYDRFEFEPDFEVILDFMIHSLSSTFNPIIFLEELAKFATNTNSRSIQAENSVKIMTINKSKGLQFDIVILPKLDLSLSEYKSDEPFIFINNNEIGLSDIQYRFNKNIIDLLDDYKTTMLNERDKIKIDKLNLLYVALTRAKHGLIIGAVKKSKDDEITSIQYLFPALGYDAYRLGEVNPTVRNQIVTKGNVSDVFDKHKPNVMKKEKIIVFDNETDDFYEALKGTVVHNALFILESIGKFDIDSAIYHAVNLSGGIISHMDINDIKLTLYALAENEFYKKINTGNVFKEKVFSKNGSLYKIDFFSIYEGKIYLVDYKYSKYSDELTLKYTSQIKRYSSILADNYDLDVEAFICYLKGSDVYFDIVP